MKRYTLLTISAVFTGSLFPVQAGTKDEVKAAIEGLSKKGNYSWTSTSKRPEQPAADQGDRRRGSSTSTGKTADGYVLTSRSFGDRSFESLRKGDKFAFKREGEWTLPEPRATEDGRGQRRGFGSSRSATPTARAADLLDQVGELKKDGEVYMGELTEEGASSLVFFGRGRRGGDNTAERPAPKGLKASAKFWIKDGVLAKYETSVTGTIEFNGNERDLSRVMTIEIDEVGTTKIEIPDAIRKKLADDDAASDKAPEKAPKPKTEPTEKADKKADSE